MDILAAVPVAGGDGAAGDATYWDWLLLWSYLALALGVSFLCSMLEASILSVTPSYTNMLVQNGSRAGRILEHLKADIDRPLSAILTLNTVAHTVGAAGVGAQAAAIFGRAWLGVISAVLTFLILILSEIVPKTIGAVAHKSLVGFTAYTTQAMVWTLWPLVQLCMGVSRLIAGSKREAGISREELTSLAHFGHDEGALRPDEARVMKNLMTLDRVTVRDVMTPRPVVWMLPAEMTLGELMREVGPPRFARIPVYEGAPDHLVGLVVRYELMRRVHAGELDKTMRQLAQPLKAVPETASVGNVMQQFITQREHLFQVADEYGGTAGIVTLEDVIETLLGTEIVDETDPVADMQALARARRWRRTGTLAQVEDRTGDGITGGSG